MTFFLQPVTKIFNYFPPRRLWCSPPSHAIRSGASTFGLHGSWKRRLRNVKVPRYQRLRAWRRKILPWKVGEHRIPRLSCAGATLTFLLFSSNWPSVLQLSWLRLRRLQLLMKLWAFAFRESKEEENKSSISFFQFVQFPLFMRWWITNEAEI